MRSILLPLLLLTSCRDALTASDETASPGDSGPPETGLGDTDDPQDTSDTDQPQDSGDSGDTDTDEPVYADAALALVSDGGNERFRVLDLASGDIVWTWDMREQHPAECTPDEGLECGAYGALHRVDPESGEDLFTFTWHRMDVENATDIGSRESRVERVRLGAEGAQIDWSLEQLDFQTVLGDAGICSAEAAGEAPTDQGQEAWMHCSMVMVHDVEMVREGPNEVEMWLADTANSRAIRVRLPTDSTCGVVEEVLDASTTPEGDWDQFTWVNDIDRVQIDGEDRLLVTSKGSDSWLPAAHGRGKLTMWEPAETGWSLEWEFPPRDTEAASFLNAPHNADWVFLDGEHYVVYGHSNGAGSHFEDETWTPTEDHLGSMGVLRLEAEGPVYLGEYILADEALGFTRDVDRMQDGTWIITDSGCKGELGCPKDSSIRHVELPFTGLEATGQDGRFQADGLTQTYHEATELETRWPSPRLCDLAAAYESDPIPQLGTGLSARLELPEGSCE